MDSQPPESEVDRNIHTGGGAYVGNSVNTGGGDFIGRDQNITIINISGSTDQGTDGLIQTRQFTPSLLLAQPFERKPFEPETIIIPSGEFVMGCTAPNLSPTATAHIVQLATYRIGKTLVTNRQFAEFIHQTQRLIPPEALWNGQNPPPARLDAPVTGINFFDALAYCDWLREQTGRNYRLPNEAQWEKAVVTAAETGFIWADVPEWTCTLWGEKGRQPDSQFAGPWQDDGRNDTKAGEHIRRVVRSVTGLAPALVQSRSGIAPNQPGAPGRRHGFRIVLL